jgi:hypothetical protein
MTGLTLTEIADALSIDKWAAEKRLRKAGVEILTREALYPLDAVERIKNVPPPGRPRKPREPAKEYVDFILKGILIAIKNDEWELTEKPKLHNEALDKAITEIKNAPNRRSRLKQFDRLFDDLVKFSMESWYREQQPTPEKPAESKKAK